MLEDLQGARRARRRMSAPFPRLHGALMHPELLPKLGMRHTSSPTICGKTLSERVGHGRRVIAQKVNDLGPMPNLGVSSMFLPSYVPLVADTKPLSDFALEETQLSPSFQ